MAASVQSPEFGDKFSGARRAAGKARRPRIWSIFEGEATPPDGMPRPENVNEFRTRDTKRKTSRTPRQVPPQKRSGAKKPKPGKKPYRIIERKKGASNKTPAPKTERIQLRWIAQARSGDKGDIVNVALFAPTREMYEVFVLEVTADRVKAHFGDFVQGRVDRYEVPNVRALNFVCHAALGGGGAASLRSDPLGKSYGSNLLRMEIDVPAVILKRTPKHVAPKALPEV
jgi:hypothetical protein